MLTPKAARSQQTQPHTLIDKIRVQVTEEGHGVAMLLGSGISAASGIPMGQEFTDYLGYTVHQVLDPKVQWDIRSHGWPKYPDRDEVDKARQELFVQFGKVCKRYSVNIKPAADNPNFVVELYRQGPGEKTVSFDELNWSLTVPFIPQFLCHDLAYPAEVRRRALYHNIYHKDPFHGWIAPSAYSINSPEYIKEYALRSMYDWRATLEFLSTITIRRGRIAITERDPSIIDSFNAHITRNKRSNLCHTMIAHLLRPLRARFMLTTNFDSLLEDSFSQLSEPLEVFHVSAFGRLPSCRAVRAQDCLVKMHGGLTETRADFSLDELPNQQDQETFTGYFCGESFALSRKPPEQESLIGLQHLLVIGYSGRDQRTISLIKHTLDRHAGFQVYWLCHSASDKTRVASIFEESYLARVHIFETSRPDLFLFELYQQITRSLPGGGFSFEYAPNVPPSRSRQRRSEVPVFEANDKQEAEEYEKKLKERITKMWEGFESVALCPVQIFDSTSGVMSFVLEQWKKLQDRRFTPLWFEMEEYLSPTALAFDIFQVLALKMGRFQLEHVSLLPQELIDPDNNQPDFKQEAVKIHFERLTHYLGIAPRKCVIFLYGRNGAGGCAGFAPQHWNRAEFQQLNDFMEVLVKCSFRVVYLPYTQARRDHDTETRRCLEELKKKVSKPDNAAAAQAKAFRQVIADTAPSPFEIPIHERLKNKPFSIRSVPATMRNTLCDVLGIDHAVIRNRPAPWLDLTATTTDTQHRRQLQFLYALTLFRQARHITAMCSEAVFRCPSRFNLEGIDNDLDRFEQARQWIQELQERHYLLVKPGGYNWCYRDTRVAVREILEDQRNVAVEGNDRRFDFLGQVRARTHFWIADWYQKAFASTGHYVPLIESIFHRFEAIRYAPFAKLASRDTFKFPTETYNYRVELASNALAEIVKALQLGRNALKFWLAGGPSWRYFDQSVIEAVRSLLGTHAEAFGGHAAIAVLNVLLDEVAWEFKSLQNSLLAEGGNPRGKVLKLIQRAFSAEGTQALEKHQAEGSSLAADLDVGTLGASFTSVASTEHPSQWREEFVIFFQCYKLDAIYGPQENSLFSIIDRYMAASKDGNREKATDILRKELPKWRISTHDSFEVPSEKLFVAIWSLAELAYFYARRAKILAHANNVTVPHPRPEGRSNPQRKLNAETELVLQHWGIVSAICWLCIDLCKGLSAAYSDFEVSARVKCNTLYGLALGYLSRFSEAHRRLNEGHALLSRSRSGLKGTEFSVLHLRRAEVFLSQAEVRVVKDQRQLPDPLFFAFIDDAWVCLEKAERSLSGASHSSLWWGRLYALKLRAFSLFRHVTPEQAASIQEEGRMPIPFRIKVQVDAYLGDILSKALLVNNRDYYRTLRLARYFYRLPKALKNLGIQYDFTTHGKLVDDALNSFPKKKVAALVEKFRAHVLHERGKNLAKAPLAWP